MRYFKIQNNNTIININDIEVSTDYDSLDMCPSLVSYLTKSKNKINDLIDQWDNFKKYTNTYEFIHTQIPSCKFSISKYKPLSRSYFKMIEILNFFNLIKKFDNKINTFHLAEGPGGFIEAIAYLRKNKNDSYTGITLTTQDNSIPNWNKCKDIIKKYNNINLEYGIDNDGNILSPNNLRSCFLKYRNKMDLITADGGFDFSVDFNNQEKLATNLIFAEICFAILTQKKAGTFILKYFDIFHKMSIDMLYLLNCFYTTITITKPCTSRVANSEKYIVCENFKFEDTSGYFKTLYKIFSDYDLKSCNITSLIKTDIPCIFINQVTEINYILGQSQIENINSTIELINNNNPDKLESIKKKNIAKCVEWCIKNNIPYHVA